MSCLLTSDLLFFLLPIELALLQQPSFRNLLDVICATGTFRARATPLAYLDTKLNGSLHLQPWSSPHH